MSDVFFGGGPLDGSVAPGGGGPPMPAGEDAAAGESESELFSRILADARALLSLSTVSEQNKLLLSKAESLLQQVKANEEKDDEAAMGGKLTPGVLRKLGGGGGF